MPKALREPGCRVNRASPAATFGRVRNSRAWGHDKRRKILSLPPVPTREFRKKMEAASVSEPALRAFKRNYSQLEHNDCSAVKTKCSSTPSHLTRRCNRRKPDAQPTTTRICFSERKPKKGFQPRIHTDNDSSIRGDPCPSVAHSGKPSFPIVSVGQL